METIRFEICSDRLDLGPVRSADIDGLHVLWTPPGVRRFLWDDVTFKHAVAGGLETRFYELEHRAV